MKFLNDCEGFVAHVFHGERKGLFSLFGGGNGEAGRKEGVEEGENAAARKQDSEREEEEEEEEKRIN